MMDGNMARFGSAALLGFSVALALGASAFACGADNGEQPRCEGATCEDGRAPDGPDGSTPSEAGQETGTTDGGRDATDTGDAADTGTNCTGPAGTLDPTFGDGGIVVVPFAGASADSVIVQADGKIVVGGGTSPQKFALLRLLSNGTLDPTFGTGGLVETKIGVNFNKSYNALAVQPDGKIIAVGSANLEIGQRSYDFAVVRYTPDGTLDPTFGSGGSVTTPFGALPFTADTPTSVTLLADGRILVGGYMISGDLTVGDMAFARYNADGSLDATFGTGGLATVDIRGTADQARGMALLATGKVIAVGTSRDPDASRTDIAAIRLNADGSLDTTFGTDGKVVTAFGGPGSQAANGVVIDALGRSLAAGLYGSASPNDFGILRQLPSGVLDPAFGSGGLVTTDFSARSDTAQAIAVDPAGAIVVIGSSLSATPTDARVALARYLSDGGLDTTFGVAGRVLTPLPAGFSGAAVASAGALAACGIVVVGGWSDEAAGGVPRIGVSRYRR